MKLVTYRVRQDCTDKRGRLRLAGQSVELPDTEPVPIHFELVSERVQSEPERAALKATDDAERGRIMNRLRDLGVSPLPRGNTGLPKLRELLALEEIKVVGGA